MKWLIRGVIAIVLLVVIAVVVVALAIDGIARRGVERGATYALGVPTTLGVADVGLLAGEFSMDELEVANPEGFETEHFLALKNGQVAVSLGSLMGDTVEVGRIALTGLDLNLEKHGGKDNVKIILENLQKLSSGDKPADPPKEEGPGKQYVIKEIDIGEITVHLKGYPVAKTIKVAPIQLSNVGSAGEPVSMAQVTGIIMRSIFQSLIAGGFELPGDLAGALTQGIAGLGALGDVDIEGIGKAAEAIGELGQNASESAAKLGDQIGGETGDKIKDAGKQTEEAAQKVTEGIGNLIGGQKKEDAPKQE